MHSLNDRLQAADSLLAPYAVKHSSGLGRDHAEDEDTLRFRFQRDRGRIVHTRAFRRLKGKTQVFVGGGGDHYRTRLTHTLEVAGISRDLARALSLNEDLAECIALAHDLGHPPFGHAGEEALHQWMQQHGSSFEHNVQSHRIVTELAEHSALHAGLNLNLEILHGLLKHSTPYDHPPGKHPTQAPSLEAQVVNVADELAYTAHDCDDGLRAGLFSLETLREITLADEAHGLAGPRGTSVRGSLIHLLVHDLCDETNRQLSSQRITTLEDVHSCQTPLVVFSHGMRERLDALRHFLWENMYKHPLVKAHNEAGQAVVLALCEHLNAHPTDKVTDLAQRMASSVPEAVKDYVAGMTDSYAFLQAQELSIIADEVTELLGR